MKTITIIAALLGTTTGVSAAALSADPAHQEMKRFCGSEGQGCWQVKRAAEELAAVLTSRDTSAADTADVVARHISHQPGGAAYRAKRAVESLAVRVASTQPDPEAFFNSLELDDVFFPDSPAHVDDDDEVTKRQNGCPYPGQSCWKRDDADELTKRQNGCQYQGQSCWKRDTDLLEIRQNGCQYIGQSCWKRGVLVRDHASDKRWCHEAGNACAVAKRAANAVLAAAVEKRQNGCQYQGQSCWKRDEAGLLEVRQNGCQYVGQSCWKRDVASGKRVLARDVGITARCNGPAGECTKAARDLQAVEIAAREVLASLE